VDNKEKEFLVSSAKSVFSTIPFIGGLLDEICFEYWGRLKQDRINRFVGEFAAFMMEYSGKDINIDSEYIKSEQFIDIFYEIISHVIRIGSDKKLQYFKVILAKSIFLKNKSDFTATFLDIVAKLDENELKILSYFYDAHDKAQINDEYYYNLTKEAYVTLGYQEDEYLFYMMDMVSKGLLQDAGTLAGLTSPYMAPMKITPFGIKFIDFIK